MEEDNKTSLGVIEIDKGVIASIAAVATQEVEGVVKVAPDISSGLWNLLNFRRYSPIKVEIDKNNELKRIQIPIVIKYGYNISLVCSKVQENVYQAVEKMSDSLVKQIDVKVQGIEKERGVR